MIGPVSHYLVIPGAFTPKVILSNSDGIRLQLCLCYLGIRRGFLFANGLNRVAGMQKILTMIGTKNIKGYPYFILIP